MRFTYLLIDFFSFLFPFLFSFHPRLKFYKKWHALFPAMIITGALFICWDIYFTHLKVWGFNPDYLTGLFVFNLPLEEVLFFWCIPYACVFTYASLPQKGFGKTAELLLSILLVVSSILLSAFHYKQLYTASTFAALGILIFAARFVLHVSWLSRFYQTYLLLLLPFLLVNGLLTGTGLAAPVVWYDTKQIFGLRVLTIPVEDVFYGMSLVLLNLMIYNQILQTQYRQAKKDRKALLIMA
ncbi:lycopene cyclase domain-containing protein [Mucilaginibacter pedocola]|uniref:Lycopene cyclase domain-containing protein n=1 Tax=Mucilaginibacter pedocola TaxID=1792845 RepID=A0A1S9P6Q9_9SPHI|nr:lycopene cyclase domain-containing protein [Mucilaginibacter pedocola]OOQ56643.1 hypothetical protein BC343_19650 [Mucilaginibacter pedocola]